VLIGLFVGGVVRNLATLIRYLLCAAAVLGNVHAIQAQTNPKLADLIDSVRPSVVQIDVKLVGTPGNPFPRAPATLDGCFHGGSYCIAGTGFFVNSNGDVVTAFHVVDGFRAKNGTEEPGIKQLVEALEAAGIHAEISIGIAIPNVETKSISITAGTTHYSAVLVATDPSHDLALLRPTTNPFSHMQQTFSGPGTAGWPQATAKYVTFSPTRPRDAEDIFACGYPLGEPGLITTSGTIASAWNTKVLLRAEAAGFSFPVEVYNVDLRINPGNSGGPVFRLSDQALIGVAVESFGSLGVVVPAKFVTAFLKSQGVSWTSAKGDSGQSMKPK
jgi:S1-C subfamily serine protease